MTKTIRALGSVLLLAALLVGIPIGLWVVGRSALPTGLPSWEQVVSTLTHPLTPGFITGALIVVGFLAWAGFAAAVLVELAAGLRGRPAPRIRGLGAQQRLAAVLLGAILLGGGAAPALAAPATAAAPHTVATQADSDPLPGPALVARDSDQSAPQTTDEPSLQTYTVQPGDSLWRIAEEQLGDGARWREIADLNYDIPQQDGHALTDSHWLEPGWQLTLPIEAPTATADVTEQIVTVQAGDTLYEIAETHLGEGERYPEIVDASRDIRQPGGVYLTDPDVIDVGWQLVIPGAPAPAAAAAEEPEPVDEDEQPALEDEDASAETDEVDPETAIPDDLGWSAPHQAVPSPVAPEQQASPERPAIAPDEGQRQDSEEDGGDVALRTTGGVGALLAAGLGATLLARRRRVGRTRPPGARVGLPQPGSPEEGVVRELRSIADPIGREAVDVALRDLAAQCRRAGRPLPRLRALRLAGDGSEVQLYLEEPAQLPHPWRGSLDARVWLITDTDLDPLRTRTDIDDVPAPWPALACVGLDDEFAHLLIDLERIGHLDVRGPDDAAHAVLAALAVELATSEWADDLQVTVVGVLGELVDALDTSRVRYLPDLDGVLASLESRAEHAQRIGEDAARQWAPEIIVVGTTTTEQQRDRLHRLLGEQPRVGIAAVTRDAGSGRWALELDPAGGNTATLQPVGLQIWAQKLSASEYAAILGALGNAAHYVPGPAWTQNLAASAEPLLADLPTEVAPQQETDADVDDPTPLFGPGPRIRVLGPVEIDDVDTSVLAGSPTHLDQAVEMIAYLALNPGATTAELSRDLWPGRAVQSSTRRSAVSRARRLLGTNESGEPYLALTGTDPLGNSYWLTKDVRTDWDEFCRLRGEDPTRTPLPDLRRALGLVRDAPFSRVREGRSRVRANRYLWADSHATEMAAAIADVACETARRALLDGRPRMAAEAADAGLLATRDEERLWRYAIRAYAQVGEHARVEQLITALTDHLTDLEVDPEPETNDLLDEVIHSRKRAQAS